MNKTEAMRTALEDLAHALKQEQDFEGRYDSARVSYDRGQLRFELLQKAAENYREAIRFAVEAREALAEATRIAIWNAAPERTWRTVPPHVQVATAMTREDPEDLH